MNLPLLPPRLIDFERDLGGIPDDNSLATSYYNGNLLNVTLANSTTAPPGSVLTIPQKTFYLMGGIVSSGLINVTIVIDGTIKFSGDIESWPRRNTTGKVMECLDFNHVVNFTITSNLEGNYHKSLGVIDGNGGSWWDIPHYNRYGYLQNKDDRPRLLNIENGESVLLEKILFNNAPFWTTNLRRINNLIVRWCGVSARRTWREGGHSWFDNTAFNTDGFDISGR